MTDASTLFLGLIAASVVVMAVLQITAVVFLARVARRLMSVTEDLRREIRPLAAKIGAIADEAHRATALATRQVERVDALVTDLRSIVAGPMRHGSAIFSGLRSVIAALLTTKPDRRVERDEEEDALFVG